MRNSEIDVLYVAYGLRRDGSIGVASNLNPVLEQIGYDVTSLQPIEFVWSHGHPTTRWDHAPTFSVTRGGYLQT